MHPNLTRLGQLDDAQHVVDELPELRHGYDDRYLCDRLIPSLDRFDGRMAAGEIVEPQHDSIFRSHPYPLVFRCGKTPASRSANCRSHTDTSRPSRAAASSI